MKFTIEIVQSATLVFQIIILAFIIAAGRNTRKASKLWWEAVESWRKTYEFLNKRVNALEKRDRDATKL